MKKLITVVIALALAFLLLFGAYATIKVAAKPELTPEIREKLGAAGKASFVELPDGVIAYGWHEGSGASPNAPVLVMVHGFSTPRFVFDMNVQALADAGFRVLTYDHYGRGYSDRPDAAYDADFYDRELSNLLETLDVKSKIHLLGYSMGGGIAATFASRRPERIEKLVLVAPIGFLEPPTGAAALVRIPVLGDWLMPIVGEGRLVGAFETAHANGTNPPHFLEAYKDQLQYRGYFRALTSSLRNFLYEDMRAEYETVGRETFPVLIVWGTDDSIVAYSGAKPATEAIPRARLSTMEGAEHDIPFAHAQEFNRTLIDFFKK